MDKSAVLVATIDFLLANHRYVSHLRSTFIRDRALASNISSFELKAIKDLRNERDACEEAMFAAWDSYQGNAQLARASG